MPGLGGDVLIATTVTRLPGLPGRAGDTTIGIPVSLAGFGKGLQQLN